MTPSPPGELTKAEWVVLNGLADDMEPIEAIFMDLREDYDAFVAKGDWLRRLTARSEEEPAAVPFGIHVEMTPAGRIEWDHPRYRRYWGR